MALNLMRSLLFQGLVLTIVFSKKVAQRRKNNIEGKHFSCKRMWRDIVDQIIGVFEATKARVAGYPIHALFLL